jgi:cytochrome c biogenesis protein CcmG/thiol:disulfide interchange protein DsbE
MKRVGRPALIVAAALACVMAMFVAVLATRGSALDKQAQSPLLGRMAPAVVGTGLDGATIQLSALRGKYVLVNFFATWCIPCQREHAQLQQWMDAHASRGDATVLGVIFDDTAANARQYMHDRGGRWPIVDDAGGQLALAFGVRGPPESFMVSPGGVVLAKYVGQVTVGGRHGLEALLAQAQAAG